MRQALGDGYVEALRAAHPDVPETVDLVMYWWHEAAERVREGWVRRFGFVTTNSITQSFNNAVVAKHLEHGSLVYAVPDHPWVDSRGGAQVRIAMTVFARGRFQGRLEKVIAESEGKETGGQVEVSARSAVLNAKLGTGPDLRALVPLRSNRGLASPGVQLSGQGFVIPAEEAARFSAATRTQLLRSYLTGRDLTQRARPQFVIDTFGRDEATLRSQHPEAYQWLLTRVKPERAQNPRASYAKNWWLPSEPRAKFRRALTGLERFIGTSRTARHRAFQFLPGTSLPETKVLIIALDDPFHLGVLSSRAHVVFANVTGGWLGVGNDSTYNHSSCFDPFPFPALSRDGLPSLPQGCGALGESALPDRIRDLAERLDAHRKRQQALHPKLTLTKMYNVLAKLRSGEELTSAERAIHEQGLVSVLRELHDELDAAVFEAYGWPATLSDEEILERLVALNAERAAEEKRGLVRWLRPEYQNPGGETVPSPLAGEGQGEGEAPDTEAPSPQPSPQAKLPWPKTLAEQAQAVRAALAAAAAPATPEALARTFQGARSDRVAELLDTLASLGQARRLEDGRYAG
jgi:hypothetical protein